MIFRKSCYKKPGNCKRIPSPSYVLVSNPIKPLNNHWPAYNRTCVGRDYILTRTVNVRGAGMQSNALFRDRHQTTIDILNAENKDVFVAKHNIAQGNTTRGVQLCKINGHFGYGIYSMQPIYSLNSTHSEDKTLYTLQVSHSVTLLLRVVTHPGNVLLMVVPILLPQTPWHFAWKHLRGHLRGQSWYLLPT